MRSELWRALGVCPGDVVALTGGGGKTSTVRRLALELQAAGRPVVFTTTTKVFPAPDMDLVLMRPGGGTTDDPDALPAVAASLARGRNVCFGAALEEGTGKLLGILPEVVAALAGLGAGAVLIEADGSGQRPLKAPAAHEPVIPACTDLVVPVVGASVLGLPLTGELVHRPTETAAAAGVAVGSEITPRVMAAALLACTRGAPPGARVIPLLGQADLPVELAEVARLLIGQAGDSGTQIGRVVLASPRLAAPVRRVVGDVAAIVLAGGASRRFGSSKLLHPWGERTLLEASLSAALQAGFREVLVVTGAYHAGLAPLLERYPVRVIENPDWPAGMSTTLKAGLHALADDPPAAVQVFLGDQPLLPATVPHQVMAAWRRSRAAIVAPAVDGVRKSPVLFDQRLFGELLALEGDEGGRRVVAAHQAETVLVAFSEPAWFQDIDAPSDLPDGKR